jgi:hypothetical protein
MIHEQGLRHEEIVNTHPLFIPDVWKTVLTCFVEMEAVQLDCVYGNTQIGWLIAERITYIPSKDSWLLATSSRSMGMLIYLLRYGIPCPDIEDIIQYAINKNYIEILLFFTYPDFKFYDGNGLEIKMQFSLQLDGAIKRNYLNIVKYCLWRFPKNKEKMLRKHVPTLTYIMSRNLLPMLKIIVPSLTLIPNYIGIKAAACAGFKSMVQYSLKHMDPAYLQKEIPDEILIATAKNGRLNILPILAETRKGFIPLEAYQKAFARGHVEVCNYIKKLFPDYAPAEKDLLEACTYGHHEVIMSLPETTYIPSLCFERAARGTNPVLIEVLHEKKPNYKFKPRILTAAIQSGNSQVFLTVFYCGKFKNLPSLPPDTEIELINRRMRTALSILHTMKYPVYTEEGLLAAARVCDLDIIKDILEVGNVKPSEKTVQNALSFIYVSSESLKKRGEAYTYLDNKFKNFSKKKEVQPDDEDDITELNNKILGRKRTLLNVNPTLNHDGTSSDKVSSSKRLKNIHH